MSGFTIDEVIEAIEEVRVKAEETPMKNRQILIPNRESIRNARELACAMQRVAAEMEFLLEPFHEYCGGDHTWDPTRVKLTTKGLRNVAKDFLDSTKGEPKE